jgi:hypothetical protein
MLPSASDWKMTEDASRPACGRDGAVFSICTRSGTGRGPETGRPWPGSGPGRGGGRGGPNGSGVGEGLGDATGLGDAAGLAWLAGFGANQLQAPIVKLSASRATFLQSLRMRSRVTMAVSPRR